MKNLKDFSQETQDALFVYLEYCNAVKSVPNKEVYEIIVSCNKSENFDPMMSFIELNHGNFEKGKNNLENLEKFDATFIERFKPKPVELSQKVQLDHDSEKEVEQFVNYDPSDNWISLTHDGNTITLSLENWHKLKDLADKVINS